jgi:hypothetical protein
MIEEIICDCPVVFSILYKNNLLINIIPKFSYKTIKFIYNTYELDEYTREYIETLLNNEKLKLTKMLDYVDDKDIADSDKRAFINYLENNKEQTMEQTIDDTFDF